MNTTEERTIALTEYGKAREALSLVKVVYEKSKAATAAIKAEYEEAKAEYTNALGRLSIVNNNLQQNTPKKLTKQELEDKKFREEMASRRLMTLIRPYHISWTEALEIVTNPNKKFATWTEDDWYNADEELASKYGILENDE